MPTTFILEIEEKLEEAKAVEILNELEEILGKNNYTLYNSEFDTVDW